MASQFDAEPIHEGRRDNKCLPVDGFTLRTAEFMTYIKEAEFSFVIKLRLVHDDKQGY